MICLYTHEETQRLKKRADRMKACAVFTALAALTACIILCFCVNTGNAPVMEGLIIGISVLAGWTVMLLYALGVYDAQAEYRHMQGILNGETERHFGMLVLSDRTFHIPKSITVIKAVLTENGKDIPVNVDVRFRDRIPGITHPTRVDLVRHFVTAVGEDEES